MTGRGRTGFAVAAALLLGFTYGMGQIVRDCSLTCNVGFRLSPIVFLLISILSFGVVSIQIRAVTRLGASRWWMESLAAGAVVILAFRGLTFVLLRPGHDAASMPYLRATYIAFYIALELLFALLWNNLFGFVRRLHPDDETLGRAVGSGAADSYMGGRSRAKNCGRGSSRRSAMWSSRRSSSRRMNRSSTPSPTELQMRFSSHGTTTTRRALASSTASTASSTTSASAASRSSSSPTRSRSPTRR